MPIRHLFLILIPFLLFGCFDEPEYADEPEIEFVSIIPQTVIPVDEVIERDFIRITISFKDGDGNLGLDENGADRNNEDFILDYVKDEEGNFILQNGERIPIFRKNYLINVYKQVDGVYELVEFPEGQSFSGNFPILNTSENDKALEGEIDYSFEIFFTEGFGSPLFKGDLVKFEIQIEDRKFNLSNVVETSPIIIGEN